MGSHMRILGSMVVLAAHSWLGGCSRQAVVHTRSGQEVSGLIDDRVGGKLLLEHDGQKVAVDEREIAEIDHPGTGAMTTGVALVVLGGALVVMDPPWRESECNADGVCMGGTLGAFGLIAAGTGLGIGGYGVLVHTLSVSAASTEETGTPRPRGLAATLVLP
jgi:hypothetical protein